MVVGVACRGRPHIDAMPVGLNFLDRYDRERAATRHGVTLRAQFHIEHMTSVDGSRIRPVWRRRRFRAAQKGSDAAQRGLSLFVIFLRRHSVSQRRA